MSHRRLTAHGIDGLVGRPLAERSSEGTVTLQERGQEPREGENPLRLGTRAEVRRLRFQGDGTDPSQPLEDVPHRSFQPTPQCTSGRPSPGPLQSLHHLAAHPAGREMRVPHLGYQARGTPERSREHGSQRET